MMGKHIMALINSRLSALYENNSLFVCLFLWALQKAVDNYSICVCVSVLGWLAIPDGAGFCSLLQYVDMRLSFSGELIFPNVRG